MTTLCPIQGCLIPVTNPRSLCASHKKLIAPPLRDALAYYGRHHNGGPSHVAAFTRAVKSVENLLGARRPARAVSVPYRDD